MYLYASVLMYYVIFYVVWYIIIYGTIVSKCLFQIGGHETE